MEEIDYNLEERTAKFGEEVISLIKPLAINEINHSLVSQIIKSSTSIGANYMEANGAESKKDFQHKIGICKKEAKETMHWLRMLSVAQPESKENYKKLWREAQELTMIFSKIIISCKTRH